MEREGQLPRRFEKQNQESLLSSLLSCSRLSAWAHLMADPPPRLPTRAFRPWPPGASLLPTPFSPSPSSPCQCKAGGWGPHSPRLPGHNTLDLGPRISGLSHPSCPAPEAGPSSHLGCPVSKLGPRAWGPSSIRCPCICPCQASLGPLLLLQWALAPWRTSSGAWGGFFGRDPGAEPSTWVPVCCAWDT